MFIEAWVVILSLDSRTSTLMVREVSFLIFPNIEVFGVWTSTPLDPSALYKLGVSIFFLEIWETTVFAYSDILDSNLMNQELINENWGEVE